ncbi:MAG TPA: hypothetical protein VF395_18245, partial [Polyangiaceae bacterium]
MTRARTAGIRLARGWGVLVVALTTLCVTATARAEPGDDLPVVKDDAAPAASAAPADQVLTSPSIPSQPGTDPVPSSASA